MSINMGKLFGLLKNLSTGGHKGVKKGSFLGHFLDGFWRGTTVNSRFNCQKGSKKGVKKGVIFDHFWVIFDPFLTFFWVLIGPEQYGPNPHIKIRVPPGPKNRGQFLTPVSDTLGIFSPCCENVDFGINCRFFEKMINFDQFH